MNVNALPVSTKLLITLLDKSRAPACFRSKGMETSKRWIVTVDLPSQQEMVEGDIAMIRDCLDNAGEGHILLRMLKAQKALAALDRITARLGIVSDPVLISSADLPLAAVLDVMNETLNGLSR